MSESMLDPNDPLLTQPAPHERVGILRTPGRLDRQAADPAVQGSRDHAAAGDGPGDTARRGGLQGRPADARRQPPERSEVKELPADIAEKVAWRSAGSNDGPALH